MTGRCEWNSKAMIAGGRTGSKNRYDEVRDATSAISSVISLESAMKNAVSPNLNSDYGDRRSRDRKRRSRSRSRSRHDRRRRSRSRSHKRCITLEGAYDRKEVPFERPIE